MRKLFVTLGLTLLACGGSKNSGFGDGTGDAGDTLGDGGGGTFMDSGGGGGGGNGDCSEAAKLVYVITQTNVLYSFYPATRTFKQIGTLSCPAPGMNPLGMTAQPNSMAVDRSGTAWVNFDSGKLFKVSTADATCTGTSFVPMQSNFVKFGMGFSSNSAGSKDETLFVVGIQDDVLAGGVVGQGLAKIDLGSMKLTTIGDFTDGLEMRGAELTGSGAGNLYGFFTSTPATLSPIDKGSAATPMANQKVLNNVDTGTAWAFSFWGGDFWYYTAASGQTSDVTQQKASSDNSISVVKSHVGFRIVGAGVSTCAPLTPPK